MSSRADQKEQARKDRVAAERAADREAARRRRLLTLGGLLAVAVVVVAAAVLISRSGTDTAPPASERIAVFDRIPQNGTKLGSGRAPVVVEEYADLQCPFCAAFATTNLPPIVTDSVKPGDVQLDLRLLTFLGSDSIVAGRFAAATGLQDREWQFVEAFYAEQGKENSGYVTENFLRDVAAKVPGLDVERAFKDAGSAAVTRQLAAAARDAARNEINSTPTFRVGPRGGAMKNVTGDQLPGAIAAALKQRPSGT